MPPRRNGAIYEGLGSPDTGQGSTMVLAIGEPCDGDVNIGRPGFGCESLRGQNNVQGSCDMVSFRA